MTVKLASPRGTKDILPEEVSQWQELESKARAVFKTYGYREIRTPIFEDIDLFDRSLGQTSDIVTKQLLKLEKREAQEEYTNIYIAPSEAALLTLTPGAIGVPSLVLRPEGTASIVRAYIQNSLNKKESLSQFYYIGPMFRGERPQKGRGRQFHQVGVEVIGLKALDNPDLDAKVIALSMRLLKELGVKSPDLKINSLGSKQDKKSFSSFLELHLKKDFNNLCEDCQKRFERNVFRILDCKNEKCREIVRKLDLKGAHLSKESKEYFEKVKKALQRLDIPFEVSSHLVRGLDYYTHTVFEIFPQGKYGSQDALGAGGRYNQLVQELGGDDNGEIGAIGFALGMERILLEKPKSSAPEKENFEVFLAHHGEEAYEYAYTFEEKLRTVGVVAGTSYDANLSLQSQMRWVDKQNVPYAIILGENEMKEKKAIVKDMKSGKQEKFAFKDLIKKIKKKLKKGE